MPTKSGGANQGRQVSRNQSIKRCGVLDFFSIHLKCSNFCSACSHGDIKALSDDVLAEKLEKAKLDMIEGVKAKDAKMQQMAAEL